MQKIRVHELAKEIGMASKELEAKIKDWGYSIKSYMSTLEEHEVTEIRHRLRKELEEKSLKVKRKKAAPKSVKRKHQVIKIKIKKPALKKASSEEGEKDKSQPEKVTNLDATPDADNTEAIQAKATKEDIKTESSEQPKKSVEAPVQDKTAEDSAPIEDSKTKDQNEPAAEKAAKKTITTKTIKKKTKSGATARIIARPPEPKKIQEPQEAAGSSEKSEEIKKQEKEQVTTKSETENQSKAKTTDTSQSSQQAETAGPEVIIKKDAQKSASPTESSDASKTEASSQTQAKDKQQVQTQDKSKETKTDKTADKKAGNQQNKQGKDSAQTAKKFEKEPPRKGKKGKNKKRRTKPAEKKPLVKVIGRAEVPLPKQDDRNKSPKRHKPDKQRRAAAPTIKPTEAPPASMPEKKAKKKAKRVVNFAADNAEKKRISTKKKAKQKQKRPISKLLAEELAAAQSNEPIMQEPVKAPKSHKGKKATKPSQQPSTLPPKSAKRKILIYETIQVAELAQRMGVKLSEVMMKLMDLGVMATANQSIDHEAAALVAADFGYEIEKRAVAEDLLNMVDTEGGEPKPRPPVVTVMGHVDHGKTSLLDAIRQADVASKEAGGITQHIGAHHVTLPSGKEVVFLDTPGHEAFTAMRARGAKVTDIVILVVAADDGVMAQTREAIDHAHAAEVPIIVAVNKIDKPEANPERVKRELSEFGLIPEEWGGETIFCDISAKKKIGIDDLLEMLALQAEVLELKADPDRPARGNVIEAKLDKGRGPVATVLVMEGTLHIGDALVCGLHHGKVRAMINDKGKRINKAGPSIPVEIQGLSGVPNAGDEFTVLPDEKKAREVAEYRQRKAREAELAKTAKVSLDNIFDRMQDSELKELNIVLKTDVQGSLEAISESLQKLSTQEIKVRIVGKGIGAISESDILLASASNAIVIGFNVRPTPQAKSLADKEHVDIRFYNVIYQAIDEVKSAMLGLLEPVYKEKFMGKAEVRQTFRVPKIGTIAGCFVLDGIIKRNSQARLLRDNVVIYTGKISSLRRFKDDVKEVQSGYECGIGLERFNDIKTGDVIEAFTMEEIAPVLEQPTEKDTHNNE